MSIYKDNIVSLKKKGKVNENHGVVNFSRAPVLAGVPVVRQTPDMTAACGNTTFNCFHRSFSKSTIKL